jgi:N-acetylmuramoyl-L-alanine amidase
MRSIRTALVAAAFVGALLLLAHSAEDKHLAIYTPGTSYRVLVQDVDGREYVGLLDLLEPLGAITISQNGSDIVLRFNGADNHLKENSTAIVYGRNAGELPAPTLVRDGKVLVPLRGVPDVVAHLVGGTTEFHRDSRRLFLGGAGVRYSAEFQKAAAPQLTLDFSAPVNPSISTEHGALRMTFTRDAVLSSTPKLSFDDKTITAAEFSESDGAAQLTVRSNTPLIATFGDGNKTITITPAPAGVTTGTATTPAAPGTTTTSPAGNVAQNPTALGTQPPAPASVVPRGRNAVIIDAAHGGNDPGARLTDKIVEKDITLALAYKLRAELEKRGIAAVLLREGDTTLSFDQRASTTDAAHPALYIALHAGALGSGVHVYTSLARSGATASTGAFAAWDTAQFNFLGPSHNVADTVVKTISKKDLGVLEMPAPVRPLNNIAAPALAVEIAPHGNIQDLIDAKYQQQVAAALADGIAAWRAKPEQP